MKIQRSFVAGFVMSLCLFSASAALAADENGKTIGQRVDTAIEQLREGAHQVTDWAREEFKRARVAVDQMGAQARVYARLHWDKALQNATIDVEIQNDGAIVLRGSVPSQDAKTKANQLTRDTVGVDRVVDQLNVSPPSK
jgi:hypothetical protein